MIYLASPLYTKITIQHKMRKFESTDQSNNILISDQYIIKSNYNHITLQVYHRLSILNDKLYDQ